MAEEEIKIQECRPCLINNCIREIKGIKSNSASPTDTWIVKFKENSVIVDNQGQAITGGNLGNCFLKIYITPSYDQEKRNLTDNSEHALDYESKIYEITNSIMVDNPELPYFIKNYISHQECTIGDFIPEKYNEKFKRNFIYLRDKIQYRPAIEKAIDQKDRTDIVNELKLSDVEFNKIYLSYILNEAVPDGTKTLKQILTAEYTDNEPYNSYQLYKLYIIIYQCAIACSLLYKYGIIHNDLHYGNVWVIISDEIKVSYKF